MFGKRTSVLAVVGVLSWLLCIPASAQNTPPNPLCGFYYYKGIGVLQIRQEGNSIVTEFPWEKGILKDFLVRGKVSDEQKPLLDKLAAHCHRGKLKDPNTIEFADFDATLDNLLGYFGLGGAGAVSPEQRAILEKEFPVKTLGRYTERWSLLPDGRLEVDGTIPLILWSYGASSMGQRRTLQRFIEGMTAALGNGAGSESNFLDEFRRANQGDCKKVCGFRIRNASELEAWKALSAKNYPQAATLFQKAAQEQPDWPFPLLGEAWARIGTKEYDLARQALTKGQSAFNAETKPFLEQFAGFLRDQIWSYETLLAGAQTDYNALSWTFRKKWLKEQYSRPDIGRLTQMKLKEWAVPQDLQTAREIEKAFPLWKEVMGLRDTRGRGPVLPLGQAAFVPKTHKAIPLLPDLAQQVAIANVTLLSGHLCLGKNDLAGTINRYGLVLRQGQLLRHGQASAQLTGLAIEKIGFRPARDLFENGRVSDSEILGSLQSEVDALLQNEPASEPAEIFAYEFPAAPATSDPLVECLLTDRNLPALLEMNYQEGQTRLLETKALLALLKAACAVKAKSIAPPFPKKMEKAALPDDPFAKDQKIRYLCVGNEAIVYSVGPNQMDESAAVPYDPANGTVSGGDILIRIR